MWNDIKILFKKSWKFIAGIVISVVGFLLFIKKSNQEITIELEKNKEKKEEIENKIEEIENKIEESNNKSEEKLQIINEKMEDIKNEENPDKVIDNFNNIWNRR